MKMLAMKTSLSLLAATLIGLGSLSTWAADERKPAGEMKATTPAKPMAAADRMDLNTATEAQLATLPGIGEARAKAIVKGRPYSGKDDLVKRKIVGESVYENIKDMVIARQK